MPASSKSAGACHGGSTSIVSVEPLTGWHVFKIEGYSKIKGSLLPAGGPSMKVNSTNFSVGGHSWNITWNPHGCYGDDSNADWSCIFLKHHRRVIDDADVTATFQFSLLDKDGEVVPSSSSVYPLGTFTRTQTWGVCPFIRRKDLEPYLENNSFSIRCDITVVEENSEASVVPRPDLDRHLGDLLDSEVGGDVTFEVGGEALVAHRCVLAARSPVFKAEFFGGPMKEKVATHVRVAGMEARVFKAMLHFIYTDSLPEIAKGDKIVMAQHLLVAADRYCLERLKWICEDMLCTFVSTRIAVTTLVLAEQHGCQRLKKACLKFLKSPDTFNAAGHADLKHLMRSCPSLCDELLVAHGLSDPSSG